MVDSNKMLMTTNNIANTLCKLDSDDDGQSDSPSLAKTNQNVEYHPIKLESFTMNKDNSSKGGQIVMSVKRIFHEQEKYNQLPSVASADKNVQVDTQELEQLEQTIRDAMTPPTPNKSHGKSQGKTYGKTHGKSQVEVLKSKVSPASK